ncbi:protein zwilch homolog [Pecten maximus]|uniref:protein zwilch homolog n=1 Tax=Pecten maximus TaxID=6579 RepID=UPI0014588BD9|nr:protein zwilch homolog [Pecten maximus]
MDAIDISEFKEVIDVLLCNPDKQAKVEFREAKFSVADEGSLADVVPTELFDFTFPVVLASSVIDTDVTEEEFIVPDIGTNDDISTRSRKARSVSHNQSEVEGSPLKLQTYADFSFSSPSHSPLNVRKRSFARAAGVPLGIARKVSSYLSLAYSPNESDQNQKIGFVRKSRLSVRRKYDLFETHQENERQPVDKYRQGSLQLEVRWKKFTSVPPLDARTVIKAQVLPGDTRSAAHSLYNALEALKLHVAGLTTSEIKWMMGYEDEELSVMDKLKALLEVLKHGDASQLTNSDEQNDEEFNNVMDTLVFHERKDLDFTDHLWTVLCKCTSYSELVECFKYVFTVLSNGELRPMVHRNNNTTVAQMVRDSYIGKLRMPNLAGVYALQLLAEIGVEKLHQDYVFTFLAKELVTHSNLEAFLKTDVKLEQKLVHLEKMHHVLEMVVMLKLFLNLPSLNLAICARAMLSHYQQEDISLNHVFAFPMQTPSLKHAFETCQPCMKKMVLTKMVGNRKESVHHLLVTQQPFRHLPTSVDSELALDTTLNKNKKYYYVRKIESVSILV